MKSVRFFNKIRDHIFVKSLFISYLHLVSDMQTCYRRKAFVFNIPEYVQKRGNSPCRR